MATFVSNRDSGGRTDEEGHYKFWNSTFVGNVLSGQQVVQNSPTTNMNVRISEGIIRIPYSDYAYQGWSEGFTLVPISTADASNPRIDRIVAYIDRSMLFTDTDINNPGMLKYKAVPGTPNAVPSKPLDSAVNSSVGASNPWVEIGTVRVNSGVTQILTANITDTRSFVNLSPLVAANHLTPVGTINDFAGSTAPDGWLLCYGQAISRTTYSALYAVLGTIYGSGDGSTTFNLPDCRGRVAAGKDNMGGTSADRLTNYDSPRGIDGDGLGNVGGQEAHVQTIGELAAHSHTVNRTSSSGATTNYGVPPTNNTWVSNDTGAVNSTGSSTAFNVVQPTIIFNKIIKT